MEGREEALVCIYCRDEEWHFIRQLIDAWIVKETGMGEVRYRNQSPIQKIKIIKVQLQPNSTDIITDNTSVFKSERSRIRQKKSAAFPVPEIFFHLKDKKTGKEKERNSPTDRHPIIQSTFHR